MANPVVKAIALSVVIAFVAACGTDAVDGNGIALRSLDAS